jgi:LacI family transcriptional regulator
MSKGAHTLQEIADHVGVSTATVSRVARGIGQVAPETRQRVLEAIEAFAFRPSHLGRALVSRRHGALGVVFPGLGGHYFSEVIQAVERESIAAQMSLLILSTHLLRESHELVLEMARRVDGLIIIGGTLPAVVVQRLIAGGTPVVLMAQPPLLDVPDLPTVRVDNRAASAALTHHLLVDHGYAPLAFVGNPTGGPDFEARWHGFLAAHHAVGAVPPAEPIRVGYSQTDGLRAVNTMLDTGDVPRGLVCANDEIALGALSAALARGLRVPQEIAVTGWDDFPLAALTTPPLTTIRQPIREMGAHTVRLLLARIAGDTIDHDDLVLPTEPVYRASCGCGPEGMKGMTGMRGMKENDSPSSPSSLSHPFQLRR